MRDPSVGRDPFRRQQKSCLYQERGAPFLAPRPEGVHSRRDGGNEPGRYWGGKTSVPLQNRVTPFGEIVAIPQRGMFTGNRGIIHDPRTRTLLSRRWTTKAWIVCACEYKGVRRDVMGGRSWTELFFLDEATALAAGHRPCFFCRREAAEAFRAAWARGNGGVRPYAPQMDAVLHRERLESGRKRLHLLPLPINELPDGVLVATGTASYLIAGGRTFRWTETGYQKHRRSLSDAKLVTPPSTVRALCAGYRPILDPSAGSAPRDHATTLAALEPERRKP